MKQDTNNSQNQSFFITIILMLLALTLLLFPAKCSAGVKLGINIALYSLIPAILPFMIFSNYVIQSGYSELIGKMVHPLFHKLFKISTNGSYAALIGFLCGYPLGSKIIYDLIKNNKISHKEGAYLFHFVNNPSLAFILCYAAPISFPDTFSKLKALFLIYVPSIVIGIISSTEDFADTNRNNTVMNNHFHIPFSKVIDDSIFNALLTTARLTGYIIIFSIFSSLISDIPFLPYTIKIILPCMLELTSGIYQISISNFANLSKFILTIIFSIFGGMSVLFQISSITNSVSGNKNHSENENSNEDNTTYKLSMSSYIKYKLFSILLCIVFFFISISILGG